jgi:hypothetical protein
MADRCNGAWIRTAAATEADAVVTFQNIDCIGGLHKWAISHARANLQLPGDSEIHSSTQWPDSLQGTHGIPCFK